MRDNKFWAGLAALAILLGGLCVWFYGWVVGSAVAAVLVVVVAAWIWNWKIGLTLTTAAAAALCVASKGLKLGIDLSGGTILVYQVDQQNLPEGFSMGAMVTALTQRLNPAGVMDLVIRPLGSDRVEIVMPKADQQHVEDIKTRITEVGQLEFRILANGKDQADLIRQSLESFPKAAPRSRWVEVADPDLGPHGRVTIVDAKGRRVYDEQGQRLIQDPVLPLYTLVALDDYNVTGDYLTLAERSQDDHMQPAVGFHFNSQGAYLFRNLTRDNKPSEGGTFERRLAILLDDKVRSAPGIKEEIGGSGIISGGRRGFTIHEVDNLVAILNGGRLPAALVKTPVSEYTVGPSLGSDTIRKGETAILVSMIAVPIFMAIYYGFAGMVANVALVLNLLLILGAMAFIEGTFTLPGLAGLALTVGMAVDANVLIYERMREELERKTALGLAIRNGFARAWRTILDSNLTTIITAWILYVIGTDQIKGFALTLMIGLVINLYTAVFVSRAIFDVWYRQGWLTKLSMLKLFGKLNLDFLKPRRLCFTISGVIIGVGLVATLVRWQKGSLMDIDFTGGTAIAVRLAERTDTAVMRRLAGEILPDVTVEELRMGSEEPGHRFLLRTTIQDQELVRLKVGDRFGFPAQRQRLELKEPVAAAQFRNELAPVLDEFALESTSGSDRSAGFTVWTPSDVSGVAEKLRSKLGDRVAKLEPAPPEPWANQAGPELLKLDMSVVKIEPIPAAAAAAKQDEPKSKSAEPSDPFAGGARVELKFSDAKTGKSEPLLLSAIQEQFNAELRARQHDNPGLLYRLSGVGPVTQKEFAEMVLETKVEDPKGLVTGVVRRLQSEPTFDRLNNFGSQVAAETQTKAIWAMVASWAAIIAYVWFRFKSWGFGVAAVVALIHDVLVALGFVALSYWIANISGVSSMLGIQPFKIDLDMVAAFLTLIGFSVNDTIVIFDRIREIRGKSPHVTYEMINESVNQTMSRTILTTLTAWVVVVILYIWGGESIHGFAFALVVGFISGTYSTIYVASPIVLWLSTSGPAKTGVTKPQEQRVAVAAR